MDVKWLGAFGIRLPLDAKFGVIGLSMIACTLALFLSASLPSQDAKAVYKTATKAVGQIETSDSVGTGFAILGGRVVITCEHVIHSDVGRPDRITVNGAKIAGVLAASQDPDIAILLLKTPMAGSLEIRASSLDLGEKAFCVGYPLGLKEQAISEGIVSSIRPAGKTTYVQTSVPISSGSSGSPLLDESGKVIGVIRSTLKDGQQNNLAISIPSISSMLEMAGMRAEHPEEIPRESAPKTSEAGTSGETAAPSQHEVNGFLLGQYKEILTKYFGKPYEVRKTEDGWEQRIYLLKPKSQAYMIFEFVPSAPDTIYAIQLTGPKGTPMLPFCGLMLGEDREQVESVLGKPSDKRDLEDIPGYATYYKDRNYSLEFDAKNQLSSVRVVGYQGFSKEVPRKLPNILALSMLLKRREIDILTEALMPDMEIYFGRKTLRYSGPARRELNDPASAMYKALFGATSSVSSALKNELSEPEVALRLRDNMTIDYVYKYPKGTKIKEVVFKQHAGEWRVWEIALL